MFIKHLVVHCSDTPNGREHNAADIHRWHLENGWDGIGYHAVIKLNGEVEMGRPEYWEGAHANPFNQESLGVCLIGRDDFNQAQMRSLEALLLAWETMYPEAVVVGHSDLNPHKTCPNFSVKTWWQSVKERSVEEWLFSKR